MAIAAINVHALSCRLGSTLNSKLGKLRPSTLSNYYQIATLTSIKSQEILGTADEFQLKKPFPYWKKGYNFIHQTYDMTTSRFNPNTKVIVVEGNVGVGKSAVAKKIADEFGMTYLPDLTCDDVFEWVDGPASKRFDEALPPRVRRCRLEQFLMQNVPQAQLDRIAWTQYYWYVCRYFNYTDALVHLLNTGQGVVLTRNCYSDTVFSQVLKKLKYYTRHTQDYIFKVRANTLCETLRPHVIVYLDAPVSYVKEKIQERGLPHEVNSPVLNDTPFLQEIENVYKTYLDTMKEQCEILEFDARAVKDSIEDIVEELETLDLEYNFPGIGNPDSYKFRDWAIEGNLAWNNQRGTMQNQRELLLNFNVMDPFNAKEMMFQGSDAELVAQVRDDGCWERVV